MTARRDPDRLIRTYLEDGPTELPERSYDEVRFAIDQTRQRVVLGPWRQPQLSKFTGFAMAAAAVLAVVAVVGITLVPPPDQIGRTGPTPTTAPAVTPRPTSRPSPSSAESPSPVAARLLLPTIGELAPGTWYISSPAVISARRLTFTVPEGWTTNADVEIAKHRGEPGEVMFTPWLVTHIFSDACQWDEGDIVEVNTIDEIADALASLEGPEASPIEDVTFGGFPAKRIELTVAPDLDVTTCTSGYQRYWPGAGPDFDSGLCCHPPGNTDVVYAVDVDGDPMVLVARHYPETSPEDRAELQAIVDSMQLEAY